MDLQATGSAFSDWSGAGLALGFCEGATDLTGDLAALDEALGGALSETIAEAEFTGKAGSTAAARVGGRSPVRKISIAGLGPAESLRADGLRRAAGAIAQLARQQRCETLGVAFPRAAVAIAPGTQAIAEGIELGLYQDRRFKSEEADSSARNPERVEILRFLDGSEPDPQAIDLAKKMCSGTFLARELVAAPANVVTPAVLAETAAAIASEYGLELEILEREDCEKRGMGAFLGVAQASDLPPKFIHLTYRPSGTPRKKVAIVGKGLTFDSGGLNIKAGAGSSIEMMKTDMGGAGATFGAAKAIAQIQPDVEVHFISAATENAISGRAMRPGDILTASNGKTIEVNNTDAEGRLTLADALVFADGLGVDAIVDLATLTGACVVALGGDMAGLWSPEASLAEDLLAAAEKAGEKFWQMPLEEKYFEGMKSVVADMKNTGPRAGGSITAALFLKQFVKDTPWAHLDVAGPVWSDKESPLYPAGATGFPVRTLVNWAIA